MVFASILSSLNKNNIKKIYVNSTSGDDNNTGTIIYPFQSIDGAHNSNFYMINETVICNLEGTFNLNGGFEFKNNWTYVGNGMGTRIKINGVSSVNNTTLRRLIYDNDYQNNNTNIGKIMSQNIENGILNLENVAFINHWSSHGFREIVATNKSNTTINIINCMFHNARLNAIFYSSASAPTLNIQNSAQSNDNITSNDFVCDLDGFDGIDTVNTYVDNNFLIIDTANRSTKGVYSGNYSWPNVQIPLELFFSNSNSTVYTGIQDSQNQNSSVNIDSNYWQFNFEGSDGEIPYQKSNWYIDVDCTLTFNRIISAEITFEKVLDDSHPDDTEAMVAWGQANTNRHAGYVSFGVSNEIIYPGGGMGGNFLSASTADERTQDFAQYITFPSQEFLPTNILRIGTGQSYYGEDFRMKNFKFVVQLA